MIHLLLFGWLEFLSFFFLIKFNKPRSSNQWIFTWQKPVWNEYWACSKEKETSHTQICPFKIMSTSALIFASSSFSPCTASLQWWAKEGVFQSLVNHFLNHPGTSALHLFLFISFGYECLEFLNSSPHKVFPRVIHSSTSSSLSHFYQDKRKISDTNWVTLDL